MKMTSMFARRSREAPKEGRNENAASPSSRFAFDEPEMAALTTLEYLRLLRGEVQPFCIT